MLKNYFKIAFRNLFKNKVYSFINIFGLALGIACCLLIGLYVTNEWNYDQFHEKADRTYRVWYEETTPDGRELLNTATPVVLGTTLRSSIPEVEHLTYLYRFSNLARSSADDDPLSESFLVVNRDFFEMFDFEIVRGSDESMFDSPSSVVISEQTAERFFGTLDPLQQVLSIRTGDSYRDYTVTAVIENPPVNSSLGYSVLMPYQNLDILISEQGRQSWFNIFGNTYITLREGVSPGDLDVKLEDMMRAALGDELYESTQYTIGLQPLTDIHLNNEMPQSLAEVTDPAYIYILAAIALLILLIACVNFMTLSISRSASRAREVGVRKTIGAVRSHLMYQFWGEAFLMTLIALSLGVVFAEVLLPFFNELSGTELSLQYGFQPVAILVGLSFLISILAGIYPALVLSGFKPVEVLKGRLNLSSDKARFQQFMVVFQFSLSIAMIISTMTIHRQMSYIQNKNLGYQKDQVLVLESGFTNSPQSSTVEVYEQAAQRRDLLENLLEASGDIESVSLSSYTPIQTGGWFRMGFYDESDRERAFHGNFVDEDFIPAMGIAITAGRNFSAENPADARRSIMVNRAAADYFGWENPVGQRLPGQDFIDHEVIGVVENFHFESLHTPVEPLVISMNPEILFSGISNLALNNSFDPRYSVRFSTGNLEEMIASIRNAWQQIAPGVPFNYSFVDEALDAEYRQEERLSRIVTTGSVLAILIACLGLFGLASLMVVRRTKEIGVRKVLGASSGSIVFLVNREFSKLVLVSFLISAPVAWYIMSNWLQDFAYRIELGVGIFLAAGFFALAIAWFSVSYQSIRATLINPTESLRSE
jgi:putative ABC transport system permease protein